MGEAVLWRRLDRPGHEYARLSQDGTRWQLTGVAVFQHEQQPCRLDYSVICDGQWLTQAGKVTGWVGDKAVDVAVSVDASGTWRINGTSGRKWREVSIWTSTLAHRQISSPFADSPYRLVSKPR